MTATVPNRARSDAIAWQAISEHDGRTADSSELGLVLDPRPVGGVADVLIESC
jgi:hypothetical protein